ncbi:hypothetical protein RHMOL_Rhmol10G0167800 [Rhododendron molle]|uniref:Uncharacterized protein n=5 Tax=Rhododendron molle TaxID=49168 RepID=A0ACC0M356_RHOML|nr:hypothetical protein RHMOL_Rhmol10G0167800 [Rhododendron molle]KAI8535355.1 hypothetical protein RHMOL_Rhmol10G0167800 [Rhododendron molle]KAI8535356.1 hypothetical protein RHMOL_Rhmol10G0167800 [Rhododendron molle]KAI8535357.1 hypothetical protein RHMOL_Rhmol10G0167800 [Rhododendron molle]KAI8535358.1 hypothetical protein RHMOL_Rhmol10G0167800 [Rhododendron molle]
MERIYGFQLMLVVSWGIFVGFTWCQDNADAVTAVYVVTLRQAPASHYYGDELRVNTEDFDHGASGGTTRLDTPRNISRRDGHNSSYIARVHDSLLRKVLRGESYLKLYSYHYLINGFAVLVSFQQAEKLSRRREVANVVLDYSVRTATTHTPQFLGLPEGAWARDGGYESAGDGIDYASPFDGDGHGTHTASIAGGNHGIPVVVAGHHFGNASGMAPHSHIAVYKALYKSFGGFAADVVAAIDQAAQDGADIISLSITPNRRPPGIATFFNPIDMALLSAVKAGIFVVQAAGNTGPSAKSMSSFSPWIFTVGAASHDRIYSNSIVLGNNLTISGVGLASGTPMDTKHTLVSAIHALNDTAAVNDMYVGECQDASNLNQDLVRGNLLICSYSIRFVLGLSTIKQALLTATNLSAAGVVFYMDPFVIEFQLNPVPMTLPGIIIPSPDDSKIFLQYYNTSLERDGSTKKVVKLGAVASISGGLKANYSHSAPKIMYYSARGPDPEDSFLDDADILKPNLVAPGNFIWAAWSSLGTYSVEFMGEDFAMMSGTSMAAPHVAGLAALIKQKFLSFSPSAIGSALSTTASLYDKNGGPLMAQRAYTNPDVNQSPAMPFDMGNGFVNSTASLDPGLIFDLSYDDYMSFLCGINGSAPVVLNYTGQSCGVSTICGIDLNLPSITIAKLNQSRVVQRTVTNIAENETYSIGWSAPYGVSLKVSPTRFSIAKGDRMVLTVSVNATMNSTIASYGRIGLFGHLGHVVNIPLSVIVKISLNTTNSQGAAD